MITRLQRVCPPLTRAVRLPSHHRLLATKAPAQQSTLQAPYQRQPGLPPLEPTQQNAPAVAQRQSRNWPPSDAGLKYLFFGSVIATPIISYYYYVYRKKHMDQKRLQMLREAQERYQRSGAQ